MMIRTKIGLLEHGNQRTIVLVELLQPSEVEDIVDRIEIKIGLP